MSNNKRLTTETEDSKEDMLYRPQLLIYKYKTCIEKPRLTDTYDPDTMNSLMNLMKSTNINTARFTTLNFETLRNKSFRNTQYILHFKLINRPISIVMKKI